MNKTQTNRSHATLVLCFVLLTLSLGACSSKQRAAMTVAVTQQNNLLEGPLALDIENHRGSITVFVNPKMTEPVVTAKVRGRTPNPNEHWTAATLVNDNGRPVLRVLSTAPAGEAAPLVDIVVRVPSCAGVRAHSDDGQVILHDVTGAIDAETALPTAGDRAIVIMTQATLTDPVLLHAFRGNIELHMGAQSAGRLQAETPQGTITVDGLSAELQNVHYARQVWTGTFNKGTADMRLTADQGNISVTLGR